MDEGTAYSQGPRLLYRSVTAGGGARDGCERKGRWANEKKEKMGNELRLSIRDAMMTTTSGWHSSPKRMSVRNEKRDDGKAPGTA